MVQGCGIRWYSASLAQYWTFGESSTIQLDLSQQLTVNADGGDDDHFQLSPTNCCAIYFYKFQLKYLSLKFEINFHVFLSPLQYSSSRKSTEMQSDHIPLNNDADSSDVLMIMTKMRKSIAGKHIYSSLLDHSITARWNPSGKQISTYFSLLHNIHQI